MSIRMTYLVGFICVCVLLTISVYLQVFDGFTPCPLCVLQRICFATLGVLFLSGLLLSTKRYVRWLINSLAGLTALAGFIFAARQIWLQYFPTGSECGVSLQYMLEVLPINEVVQKIFSGSAECTLRGWSFLFLDMAEWSLVWFAFFFCLTAYLFTLEKKK